MKTKKRWIALSVLLLCLISLPALAEEPAARARINGGAPKAYQSLEAAWNDAAGAAEAKIWLLADWTAAGGRFGTGAGFGKTGNLLVPAGANITLDLNGHTIDRKMAQQADAGCVIDILGKLTVSDGAGAGKITGGYESAYGGGIVVDGGELALLGGAIEGNKAYRAAGVYLKNRGSFTMSGGSVAGNAAKNLGGGVYAVGDGASVALEGGSIHGNTASSGGGVLLYDGAALTMSGGKITENTLSDGESRSGAGVLAERATVTMRGGEISKNLIAGGNDQAGGGVALTRSSFTMSGGEIFSNRMVGGGGRSIHGGGVMVSVGSTFNMSGGGIRKNFAPVGCGVYLSRVGDDGGKLNLSGSATITENAYTASKVNANVCAADARDISVGALDSGAAVYISTPDDAHHGKQIAVQGAGFTDASLNYLFFDGPSGTYIYRAKKGEETAILCGDRIDADPFAVNWSGGGSDTYGTLKAAFDAIDAKGESCTVTMRAGAQADAGAKMTKIYTVTLKADGAGMRLTRGGETGPLIDVSGGGTLILQNITLDGNRGGVTGPVGSLISVGADCHLTLKSGATLANNYATRGGAADITNGWFIMETGAVVENCAASEDGGGVRFNADDKNYTLSLNGTIRNCEAGGSGGGLYYAGVAFPVIETDTVITRSAASADGGGLYAEWTELVSNNNVQGVYSYNTASKHGGGLYLSGDAVLAASVSRNEAKQGGGAYSGGDVTLDINSKLSGNRARAEGGGLLAISGSFNSGSEISGNEAADGGGAYITGTLNAYGEISGNTATGSGGGVYYQNTVEGNNAILGEGSVKNNGAGEDGGGVYAVGSLQLGGDTPSLPSAQFTGNVAGGKGGGAFAEGKLSVYMASVTGNAAGGGAGGVYWTGAGSLKIGCAATLKDNYLDGGTPANLFLPKDKTFSIPEFQHLTGAVGLTLGDPSPDYENGVIVSGAGATAGDANHVRLDVQPETIIVIPKLNANNQIMLANSVVADATVYVYQDGALIASEKTLNEAFTNHSAKAGEIRFSVLKDQLLTSQLLADTGANLVVTGEGAHAPVQIAQDTSFAKQNCMIAVNDSGKLLLEDIRVKGATDAENSIIDVAANGELTVGKGVKLTGNAIADKGGSSFNGGAIRSNGITTLRGGCEIADNAAFTGGAVYAEAGTLAIEDTDIRDNKDTNGSAFYGAVFIGANASLTLSGAPLIEGNEGPGSSAANLHIGKPIAIGDGGLNSGARVGVSHAVAPAKFSPVTLTEPSGADYSLRFFSDNSAYRIADVIDAGKHTVKLTADKLSVAEDPKNSELTVGENAEFTVKLSGGSGVYSYQWQKKAPTDADFTDIPNATGEALSLSAVTEAMSGYQYRCAATDGRYPSDTALSAAATLTVKLGSPLRVAEDPKNSEVTAGENAEFTVKLSGGSGVYSYQWQKKAPTEADFADIPSATGETLSLSAVTKAMNGYQYRCAAADGMHPSDTALSAAATLTVNPDPKTRHTATVRGGAGSGSYYEGDTVTIEANAPGDGTRFVMWRVLSGGAQLASARSEKTSFPMPASDVALEAVFVFPVTDIDMIESREMEIGEAGRLSLALEPLGALPRHLSWKSDAPSVAGVDDTGLITAKSPGVALITATSRYNSAVTALCKVTVKKAGAAGKIPPIRSLCVGKGNTLDLKKLFGGLYAWQSDNPAVASVSEGGVLKGKSTGDTVLRGRFGGAAAEASSKSALVGDLIELRVKIVKKGAAVSKIKLSAKKLSLDRGEKGTVSAKLSPADAADKTLIWMSGDDAVASVDGNGCVTGVGAGKTKITAIASSGIQKSFSVTVSGAGQTPAAPAAAALSISPDARAQAVGERFTLSLSITPSNADTSGLSWESANPAVATVNQSGLVTGVGVGETEIRARLGTLAASCRVKIESADEAGQPLTLSVNFLAVAVGKKLKLNELTGFAGSWSCEDEQIASVTKRGALKAKRTGETKLKFTVGVALQKDASFMGKALVAGDSVNIRLIVVPKGRAVKKIRLSGATVLARGEKAALKAVLSPVKAIHKDLFYHSANPAVATVNEAGLVTGVAPGKAKITATATSGVTKSVTVTVSEQILEMTLSKAKASLKEGEKLSLALSSHLPAGLPAPALKWISDKESVATVDANGLVTALKKGKATIIATAPSGAAAKCRVTVK